tara:strand:+ start:2698 stop:3363 length:666 start_codon:yes stop_codon:yes gene_type:complete
MSQDHEKIQVAKAALHYIDPNTILGLGAGSTVTCLLNEIEKAGIELKGVVTASSAIAEQADRLRFNVMSINEVSDLHVYIDGADEVNRSLLCLKGGGGAQTLEKVMARMSKEFICIVDQTKLVKLMGKNIPVSIEVINSSRSFVARECRKLNGRPVYRSNFKTDHGNDIIDVYDFDLSQPIKLEETLNQIPGVVGHGLFALDRPNLLLVESNGQIEKIKAK